MPIPEFGIIYSRLYGVMTPASFARTAEALGYDAVWITEGPRLSARSARPDPGTDGSRAHEPSFARVGSCIIASPRRNPAVLAKEVATLDFPTTGCITLGVAVGGSALPNPPITG